MKQFIELDQWISQVAVGQTPGDLILSYGPRDRVVKINLLDKPWLVHVTKTNEGTWTRHCEAVPIAEPQAHDQMFQANQALVDACRVLTDLEP